jgi:hypothetical protein
VTQKMLPEIKAAIETWGRYRLAQK